MHDHRSVWWHAFPPGMHCITLKYSVYVFAVLPKEDPVITGGKLRYSLGDPVDVNCTSANSKPAADISWFINGKPVSDLMDTPICHGSFLLLCKQSCCEWREQYKYSNYRGVIFSLLRALQGNVSRIDNVTNPLNCNQL